MGGKPRGCRRPTQLQNSPCSIYASSLKRQLAPSRPSRAVQHQRPKDTADEPRSRPHAAPEHGYVAPFEDLDPDCTRAADGADAIRPGAERLRAVSDRLAGHAVVAAGQPRPLVRAHPRRSGPRRCCRDRADDLPSVDARAAADRADNPAGDRGVRNWRDGLRPHALHPAHGARPRAGRSGNGLLGPRPHRRRVGGFLIPIRLALEANRGTVGDGRDPPGRKRRGRGAGRYRGADRGPRIGALAPFPRASRRQLSDRRPLQRRLGRPSAARGVAQTDRPGLELVCHRCRSAVYAGAAPRG